MTDWLPLGTALAIGFVHALEFDHMLAVTTFVAHRPPLATAARFGFRWGIGHSVAVLGFGAILLATGFRLRPTYVTYGEVAVGIMLVGLGVWSLRATGNLHVHAPGAHGAHDHVHVHAHTAGDEVHGHNHERVVTASSPALTPHRHGVTLVGLLHGLAGTSAVVAIVPVTVIGSTRLGIWYLVVFSIGVTAGMTVYAFVAAVAMRRAADRSMLWGQRIARVVGASAILLGGSWVWHALK